MIIKNLDNVKHYDVVILGAGPAGITTAMSLPASIKVLLVEAGDLGYSDLSQQFYDGTVVGDTYSDLRDCRLRQLGGSSLHWGGKTRTLDEFDFSVKDYVPKAHWPIQKKDIDKFLVRAAEILNVKPHFQKTPCQWDPNVLNLPFEFSPVRFKRRYFQHLVDSKNIDLIVNTAMTAAKIKDSSIKEVTLSNTSGEKAEIQSNYYIFAMGGIENSRILKYVASENPQSALSKNKNIGAYWMEHPHATIGDFFYNLPEHTHWHVGISDEKRRELKILACNLNFTTQYENVNDGKVKKLLRDLMCANETIGSEVSLGLGRNYCGGHIDATWEQEPRFDNRVDLDAEVDAFGIPKPILRWERSDMDLRTIRKTAEYVAESMAKSKQAKVRIREWVWTDMKDADIVGGGHHLGGTRMSSSKDDGVVDANLKVWDMSNLYIAGSSVFPSGGHANPTLTITQLALRLAEHLTTRA